MIITLCGSARFESWFRVWNTALGLAGHLPFGLCGYPSEFNYRKDWYTAEQKAAMDRVHFAKIQSSEAILVLNVFAYIGESTMREIAQARLWNKEVHFLESWAKGNGICGMHNKRERDAAKAYGVPEGFGSPIDTSSYKDPWSTKMLGPGGPYRSAIVSIINSRVELAKNNPPPLEL